MAIIFHITSDEAWAAAGTGYRPAMFAIEGFTHCSTQEQVIQVANARFRGQLGLALLSIDTDKINAEIVYENLEGGEQLFPHIYGEINVDAVVQVSAFEPGADGLFVLPSGLGDV